jgi:hypothetical protein
MAVLQDRSRVPNTIECEHVEDVPNKNRLNGRLGMGSFRRLFIAVGVAAALTVFTVPAWAQSQVTYSLAGVETAATSTEGTFVGVALASDDFGIWGAVIDHSLLSDPAPTITAGGGFAINGQTRDVQGVFMGGTITSLGGSCRKETFAVIGEVALVDGSGAPNGGSGEFHVTLTHYGRRGPGGQCVTFFATVDGFISLALP